MTDPVVAAVKADAVAVEAKAASFWTKIKPFVTHALTAVASFAASHFIKL